MKQGKMSTWLTLLAFLLAIFILVVLQKNKGNLGAALKDVASLFGR